MQDTTHETLITRTALDDGQRMAVPARLFGVMFTTRVEPYVFGIARSLSADYAGGYWEFYSLSSGGFYMAPSGEEHYGVRCGNVSVRQTRLDGRWRDQYVVDGCQRCGSRSAMRLAGCVGSRSSTSRR